MKRSEATYPLISQADPMHALEQLGFDPDTVVAVVHADDIGMSHAANVGAFETIRSGPATCGSLMVPCPWFTEAAAWARDEPRLDHQRDFERTYYGSDEGRAALAAAGVHTIGMRHLRDLLRSTP